LRFVGNGIRWNRDGYAIGALHCSTLAWLKNTTGKQGKNLGYSHFSFVFSNNAEFDFVRSFLLDDGYSRVNTVSESFIWSHSFVL
jgi:hypothetical protein